MAIVIPIVHDKPRYLSLDLLQKSQTWNHRDAEVRSFLYFSQCPHDSVVQKRINNHYRLLMQEVNSNHSINGKIQRVQRLNTRLENGGAEQDALDFPLLGGLISRLAIQYNLFGAAEKQRIPLEEEGVVFVKDKVDFKKYGWKV